MSSHHTESGLVCLEPEMLKNGRDLSIREVRQNISSNSRIGHGAFSRSLPVRQGVDLCLRCATKSDPTGCRTSNRPGTIPKLKNEEANLRLRRATRSYPTGGMVHRPVFHSAISEASPQPHVPF